MRINRATHRATISGEGVLEFCRYRHEGTAPSPRGGSSDSARTSLGCFLPHCVVRRLGRTGCGFPPIPRPNAGRSVGHMFNISRTLLALIAAIAVVLFVFSLIASFFPGWVLGIILGIYVIVALFKQQRHPVT